MQIIAITHTQISIYKKFKNVTRLLKILVQDIQWLLYLPNNDLAQSRNDILEGKNSVLSLCVLFFSFRESTHVFLGFFMFACFECYSVSKLLFSQSTIWLEPDNVCPRKIRNLPSRKLRNLSSKWGCFTHWRSELEEINWKWEDKWRFLNVFSHHYGY